MLDLPLSSHDVALIRMAHSPLWEVVASIRALDDPAAHAIHLPWVRSVRPHLAHEGIDIAPIIQLVAGRRDRLPAFLTPTPTTPVPDIAMEVAELRATPAAHLRRDLGVLQPAPIVDRLRDDPQAALDVLCDAVERYWDVALEPHWPRMRAVLDADVTHRSREAARGGADRLLNGLDPAISWRDGTLSVAHQSVDDTRTLDGRGLVLSPSLFLWPRVASKTDEPWQPVLRYPARGVATLWAEQVDRVPDALGALIGRSRAGLLVCLSDPSSTTDLARRTGLSPAAVSEHLQILRGAGLLTAQRAGRNVLYHRTSRGDDLVGDLP